MAYKNARKIYESEIGHTVAEVVEPRERNKEGTEMTYQKTALKVGGFPGVNFPRRKERRTN